MVIEIKNYLVTYKPFAESDITSEMKLRSRSESDVFDYFKANFPMWQIVIVKELN